MTDSRSARRPTAVASPAGAPPDYVMTITLEVLNHLGIHLYSNVPTVLAEIVANSWDADAHTVDIVVSPGGDEISITDTGSGMTRRMVNDRYLVVGYQRRVGPKGETIDKTPEGRPVMGRKGIGKLSVFSVANEVEIYTIVGAERSAFRMTVEDIKKQITPNNFQYVPTPIDIDKCWPSDLTKGTRVVLRRFRRKLGDEAAVRRRIARRVTVLGPTHLFEVSVNGIPVGITDRGYWDKIQYLWTYGKQDEIRSLCSSAETVFANPSGGVIRLDGRDYPITGWIGTVRKSTDLRDPQGSLSKIALIVRGKVAEEDLLNWYGEGGVFTRYVVGDIEADVLDDSEKDDIATTGRQLVIEDDPRFSQLREFLDRQIHEVQNKWLSLREREGVSRALEIADVKDWFGTLQGEDKRRAESLFGKINQLTIDDALRRAELFRHGVVAFESLRLRRQLDLIESISEDNIGEFAAVFGQLSSLEEVLYHQIVDERLATIRKLQQATEQDVREKVIQNHLFNHLWLLDTHWDRATVVPPLMERSMARAFNDVFRTLPKSDRRMRIDIKYKSSAGAHIIVELKRASAKVTTPKVYDQISRYMNAARKVLSSRKMTGPVEGVVVLGSKPTDWVDDDTERQHRRALEVIGARVVLYDELIKNAEEAYDEYLSKRSEATEKIQKVIEILSQESKPEPALRSRSPRGRAPKRRGRTNRGASRRRAV